MSTPYVKEAFSLDIIADLLKDIPMPRMVLVQQKFIGKKIDNIPAAIQAQLSQANIVSTVKPGMQIAIAVGSRGIANLPVIVTAVVKEIKKLGASPFIVPAMGSHGGATAPGQQQVLSELGVTPASAGCPIYSSMEVVELGRLPNGLPVYIDKLAYNADGIVVLNRIKPHTAFRGINESGLVKMITIGLGKQKGAESCHAFSFKYMAEHILAMAKISLVKAPILFGIGIVENAYDQTMKITAVPAAQIPETDAGLLTIAKENMAKIYFNTIDVLIIDRIGKDISGDGMDPNITGRYPTPYASGGPCVAKMVVLDLTDRTNGNANGMGTADFSTRRLFNKIDFPTTYANGLTSTVVGPTHVPTILESDRDAIRAAIKTCNAQDNSKIRIVRIKDTLHLDTILISEFMLAEALRNPQINVLSQPRLLAFNESGDLIGEDYCCE